MINVKLVENEINIIDQFKKSINFKCNIKIFEFIFSRNNIFLKTIPIKWLFIFRKKMQKISGCDSPDFFIHSLQ